MFPLTGGNISCSQSCVKSMNCSAHCFLVAIYQGSGNFLSHVRRLVLSQTTPRALPQTCGTLCVSLSTLWHSTSPTPTSQASPSSSLCLLYSESLRGSGQVPHAGLETVSRKQLRPSQESSHFLSLAQRSESHAACYPMSENYGFSHILPSFLLKIRQPIQFLLFHHVQKQKICVNSFQRMGRRKEEASFTAISRTQIGS